MRIVVDAFGGDNAPLEIIKGSADASNQFNVDVTLFNIFKFVNDVKFLYVTLMLNVASIVWLFSFNSSFNTFLAEKALSILSALNNVSCFYVQSMI